MPTTKTAKSQSLPEKKSWPKCLTLRPHHSGGTAKQDGKRRQVPAWPCSWSAHPFAAHGQADACLAVPPVFRRTLLGLELGPTRVRINCRTQVFVGAGLHPARIRR
jgi:hypothetical protein